MTQRDNILQELNDLESSLAKASSSNVYHVPGGYFDGLASEIMLRIKAIEGLNSREELTVLSPFMSTVSRATPYKAPSGYFEEFEKNLMQIILIGTNNQSAKEEIEQLSPLLSGLKKEMPYSIPADYFATLNQPVQKTKVVSITDRKWFRYAAAAVVTGFIALGGFLFLGNNHPSTDPQEVVKKSVKNISTDAIDDFIDLADAEKPVLAQTSTKEDIKELVKNIPDSDIQNFLNDVQAAEPDASDDILN